MEFFGLAITLISFVIGIFAVILARQTVKNGKIIKESFTKMDERFAEMEKRAEQRHQEVLQLLEKGFGDTARLLEKGFGDTARLLEKGFSDMGEWMKRTEQILEKGFSTVINEISEIKQQNQEKEE